MASLSNKNQKEGKSISIATPSAVSIGTMEWNNTGSWRYVRPVYENKVSPCIHGCPCGNDAAGFLSLAQEGRFKEALDLIRETNPFPGVCGRACYHPCEEACNRDYFDTPIAIQSVERFLADIVSDEDAGLLPEISRRLEKVAVVGAGPAGLSCAYQLARHGYGVTVFEANSEPGGLLRYGIPEYRLPKHVVRREIEQILALGIELKTNQRLGTDFTLDDLKDFSAVYLAIGAYIEKRLNVPGEDHPKVIKGLELLKRINDGESADAGRKTLVIGGGNTAIDVGRSAVRLGAKVTVACIEREDEMPAHKAEVADAKEEGVEFLFGTMPTEIRDGEDGGLAVNMVPVRLGEPDPEGWRAPVPMDGNMCIFQTDTLIKAIGQTPDLSFFASENCIQYGRLAADQQTWMVQDGIFAGGDVVREAPGTVSGSIGIGRNAACSIHHYIQSEPQPEQPRIKLTPYENLNIDYFKHKERVPRRRLSAEDRIDNFREIDKGMLTAEAIAEARRCFQCGNCNMCDNCLVFCPDMAIARKKDGAGYDINYYFCKGCGICIQECPRDALSIEKEVKWKYKT